MVPDSACVLNSDFPWCGYPLSTAVALSRRVHACFAPRFVCGEDFMESRRCAACGQTFRPRPQVPRQSYCRALACQRERRRRWQQARRRNDPDYHDNQARAQRAWRKRNPDYSREYRHEHPNSRERNRTQQRERNDRRRARLIAKMDVSTPVFPIPSGIYQISQARPTGIAKMDAWTVKITLLSEPYDRPVAYCKERT